LQELLLPQRNIPKATKLMQKKPRGPEAAWLLRGG
jgi:hypothetical protein